MKPPLDDAEVLTISRPDPALWTYYLLRCLAIPPLFPILVLPSYFRYHTMRYRFDADGVSMSWGILFRREVILNYARIQDIHLRSNVVERWLGLGRILVQTASGSSSPELTIEGLKQYEQVRDFLYARMRGVREAAPLGGPAVAASAEVPGSGTELAELLREVSSELRAINTALQKDTRAPSAGRHV